MKTAAVDKINQGLFDLVRDTKAGNETLIQRSKVLDATAVLVKALRLHTQRRLTGKLNANPDETAAKLFAKFRSDVEVI